MNDQRTEYLPANGNGNGNGNGKIFDLARHDDPLLAKIVPQARREVCLDTRITEAARMFYCFLTDASLTFGFYVRRGVVRFANSYLAIKFRVSEKTIQNWKHALISTGRIWITEHRMKNSFPLTTYNITAILGQQNLPMAIDSADGSLAEDDAYTFNNRRPARSLQRDPATGKWLGRGGTPMERPRPPQVEKPLEFPVNPAPNEKNLPSPTAIDCRPQRQNIAVHNGNGLPSATATDCRAERQKDAVVNGKILPLSTANGCRCERQSIAEKGKAGDVSVSTPEVSFKRSTGVNALKAAGGAKRITAENLLLLDVGAMMERWRKGSSKAELEHSGAWWRLSHRANADLIQRVLADTNCAVKEGRIKTTPGAYAVDLWKRWQKDMLKDQLRKKTAASAAA
jgi:hypothetical protein